MGTPGCRQTPRRKRFPPAQITVAGVDGVSRASRHDPNVRAPGELFEDLLSAFRQDVTTTRYETWAEVLDYCRRSANPVGRLVLRLSGYATPSSIAHPTRCARRCSSRISGRTWRSTGGAAGCTCPRKRGGRTAPIPAIWTRGSITPAWRPRCATAARTRALFEGPAGVRRRVRPPALRAARDMARRHPHSRLPRASRLRRLHAPEARHRRRIVIAGTALWRDQLHARHGLDPSGATTPPSITRSWCFPPAKRKAIGVVWDFCRAVDDAVDEAAVSGDRARAEVAQLAGGGRPRSSAPSAPLTPQGGAQAVRRRSSRLSRQPFDDLIDGVEMDLRRSRYETFDELAGYCRRVASAVGLICIEIFGCRDSRSRDYAINLGLALQLTNIIRDVGVDLAQRPRLPAAGGSRAIWRDRRRRCARHGHRAGARAAGLTSACARANSSRRRAGDAACRGAPARGRRDHGRHLLEILQRIERRGYDVFTRSDSRAASADIARARSRSAIWATSSRSAVPRNRTVHGVLSAVSFCSCPWMHESVLSTPSSSAAASPGLARRPRWPTPERASRCRGAAGTRRARHGVSRSRNRRARRQRAAHPDGLLRRDTAFLERIGAADRVRWQTGLSLPMIDRAATRAC